MFRRKIKGRNLKQNLSIASLLSFVAGIVNAVGFLSVHKFTTNVTGHFANIVDEVLNFNFNQSFYYLLFVLCFLVGAFFSNLLIVITNKISEQYKFIFPIFIEILILTTIGLFSINYIIQNQNLVACSMLFAMGMQNSLVTTISNSVVRTTHLTGLFTDLGIEISQLVFTKQNQNSKKLKSFIKLRLTIIFTFFLGGVVAGIFYNLLEIKTLLIASLVLLIGLSIDYVNVMIRLKRIKNNNHYIITYNKKYKNNETPA